jgi:subtilisin-like proprotein convertase family protein
MTGRSNPTGDPFDVDYVAHEIGHQMGGYHTHNGTGGCGKSGSNTEVEPGSGSTIMGYAGICAGQNVEKNSDDYFNYVNIRDISVNIQGGVSSQCFEEIKVSNLPPTANAGANYTIPVGTAFQLAGSGTDPNSDDVLTYNWEQNDNENMQNSTQPSPLALVGPMFRSRPGTTAPSRYFPQLSDILANNLAPTWEVIPEATRNFEFALTVRDNVIYGGQTADDLMQIRAVSLAGPFVVSSQNNNTTWIKGETETITWNVANTNNILTVNCQIVNILFSASGDFTDTVILKAATSNDGSEDIIVPSSLTSTGKLMIKAADNIFLDVNNATIIIAEATVTPTFFLTALELSKSECTTSNAITYEFEYKPSTGFVEIVTFSASGIPSGATASFSPETASTTDDIVTMTLVGFKEAKAQDYTLVFTGASATLNKSESVNLTLKGTNFDAPVLTSPVDSSVGQSTYPKYKWSEDTSGVTESYVIEIAEDANFTTITETATITSNSYNQNTSLLENTSYFWRVRPKNECGVGAFSSGNTFSTGITECLNAENNTSSPILSTLTTSSTITLSEDKPISDLNVRVNIAHAFIGDVVVELVSPAGTSVILVANQCDDGDDMQVIFDDLGATFSCSPSIPAISGTLKPVELLSAFNGESSLGTWTLNVTDTDLVIEGFLNSWGIEYCIVKEPTLAAKSFNDLDIVMYPNPATHMLSIQFDTTAELTVTLFDLLGRKVLSKVLDKNNSDIDVSSIASGTYIVQMENGRKEKIIKNLIIE